MMLFAVSFSKHWIMEFQREILLEYDMDCVVSVTKSIHL